MPAVGDQHRVGQQGHVSKPPTAASVAANPFEERTPHMSEYTAQEIATLQSRLDKQLGPEYISARPGAGGQKVHYLAAEKCINLANEVFGFNGWSSAIQNVQIDFVDENANTGKVSLGLSVIVRVSLRDGTFHEDIGYGHIENCKGKAAAFEKAKKEGTTDALKRALRNFGNVLGNCIYDKEYLAKVTKVKAGPTRWDVANLHRHPDYAPVKKEPPPLPQPIETKPKVTHPEPNGTEPQLPDIPKKSTNELPPSDPDGEFGSDVFDEADFVEPCPGNPDEICLETESRLSGQASLAQQDPHGARARGSLRDPPEITTPSKPDRTWAANRQPPPHPQNNIPTPRTNIPPTNPQPAKPVPATPTTRPPQPPNHNQNPRPAHPQHSKSSQDPPQPVLSKNITADFNAITDNNATAAAEGSPFPETKIPEDASVGFFSARAAEALKSNPMALKTAPQFDPRADSPSIRKTAGINHNASAPVLRKTISANPSAITTAVNGNVAQQTGSPLPGRESSNPPNDFGRRVGAPGGFNSPVTRAQTSSYRPPVRRPADFGTGNAANPGAGVAGTNNINGKRLPLGDVTNAPAAAAGSTDAKRARLSGGTYGDSQQEQQAANYAQQQQQQQTGAR